MSIIVRTQPKPESIVRNIPSRLIVALAGLLLTASFVGAQGSSRETFYLESIRRTLERLESISPQGLDATVQAPNLDRYQIDAQPGNLSLRRNFTRSVLDLSSAPLGVGYQESTVTEASLSLSTRTGLSFSSTQTDVGELLGDKRDQKRVDVMGLQQAFGSGEAASTLGFTRTVTRTTPYLGVQTSARTDALSFASGLTKRFDIALKGSQTESDVPGGYEETDLQGAFTVKFSGGTSPLGFARNIKLVNGVETTTEKVDLAAPLAWRGSKVLAEHHSAYTLTGGVLNKQRTTHLLLPLMGLASGTLLDYAILGQDKGAGMVETRTTHLVNPFTLAGRSFAAEETFITLHQSGSATETLQTKFSAPMAGGRAVIQHQTVSSETASGETEQRQLSVVLPTIKMDRMSVQAQRVSTDNVGVSSQDVTSVNVSARPLKPLQVEARYVIDDRGELQAAKNQQLHTRLALSKDLSLQGHLTEAEFVGGTESVLRLVELVRDRGKSGLGLRAGLASYVAPDEKVDGARRLEVCAGKASGLAISAAYSEYDTASMARYPDDALVALSVQHGDPKDFALRWRYEDQPTRLAPLQAVDVAMPALGGSLQMSYQSNPLAPDGKSIRQAAQYDATLGRKVFGDINLQLGYRYLDYDEQDLVDQNIRIQLDGGHEAREGKLAISYLTGDFCKATGSELPPGSSLDISYARAWGASSKLTLTLARRTAPLNTFSDGSVEGRLECSLNF